MRTKAAKYAEDFSIDREYINRRILRSALRTLDTSAVIKQAAHVSNMSEEDKKLERVAKQYALYKIAFLNDISSRESDIQLTADLLIRQNQVY